MSTIRQFITIVLMALLLVPTVAYAQDSTPTVTCTTVEECQKEINRLQNENEVYKQFIEDQGLLEAFRGHKLSASEPTDWQGELLTPTEYANQKLFAILELACTTEAKDEIYVMYYQDGMSVPEIYAFLESKPLEGDFSAQTFKELTYIQVLSMNQDGNNRDPDNPALNLPNSIKSLKPDCLIENTIEHHTPGGE